MHGFECPTLVCSGEPTRPADIEDNTICAEHDRNHLGFACTASHGFDGEHHIEYTAEQVVKMRSMLIGTLPK